MKYWNLHVLFLVVLLLRVNNVHFHHSHQFPGYGQTECTAVATMTLPTETIGGHVGGPVMCAHIKLVDVAELDYYSKDGKGEICIKGPCVMSGYYKDEVKTKEAIDEDGWLHTGMQLSINIVLMTGDVGMWLPNGALKIIDRKKHIFKLQQGEYVAPEKIENVYDRSNFVAQVFIIASHTSSPL